MITSNLMKIDSIRSLAQQPYQPKGNNFQPRFPTPTPSPTIQAAQNVVFCSFHDIDAHTNTTCPKNLRMNEIMGYVDATTSPIFVPTPSSNVVLPQTDNFDCDFTPTYFQSEPFIEEKEYLCHYSLAANHRRHSLSMFIGALYLHM